MTQSVRTQTKIGPIKTSVCEIAASPTRFSGETVVLSGHYESDGIERSVIIDQGCKDVGIAVSMPDHFDGEADLNKALSVGRPGTLDKTIKATFTGRFQWNPHGTPKRILGLTGISDVTVAMK